MGRLRKLPKAGGPEHGLLLALRDLHLRAGEPSTREIARRTQALSHDTVYRVLTGPGLPTWGPLELIVEVLNGDIEEFRTLWITARRQMDDAHVGT